MNTVRVYVPQRGSQAQAYVRACGAAYIVPQRETLHGPTQRTKLRQLEDENKMRPDERAEKTDDAKSNVLQEDSGEVVYEAGS